MNFSLKDFCIILSLLTIFSCSNEKNIPALKTVFKPYFPIGAAIGQKHLHGEDSALLAYHFSSVTAENDMKPSRTLKGLEEFSFPAGERLLDFAESHDMMMRGHTLVWHNQTPDWFYRDSLGSYLTKEKLFERMRRYIHRVLDNYRGRIYAWDVVNEAIADSGEKFYRDDTDWYKVCGPEYIEKAFTYAHEADSTVKLFYNDYNLINPVKRDKVYEMIKEMLEKGVPIHGIGMQGHWRLENVNRENLTAAIDLFASLGVEVQITELDISIYPYYSRADRPASPEEIMEYTPEIATALAARYREVFQVLREKSDVITGVTFWGVTDKNTWLTNHVLKGRTDYPLLFDAEGQPKAAFWSVVEL